MLDNLLITSYGIEVVDRIKSLPPSSLTDDKINSVDISTGTSSSEDCLHSKTLPLELSEIKGRLTVLIILTYIFLCRCVSC